MVKLMIIADDFTGALDTGIHFVKRGIKTQVFAEKPINHTEIDKDTEVLVIDIESRPMSAGQAYEAVKETVEWAVDLGVTVIFKKTDSALRGNIGSELQAVTDGSGYDRIYFFPGHPKIGRLTKNGTHYIEGDLLENSVFGNDPFEPVTRSYIPDIIGEQSHVSTQCLTQEETIAEELIEEEATAKKTIAKETIAGKKTAAKIVICDTEKQQDIRQRIDELLELDRLRLVAGCAALAEVLAEKMDFVSGNIPTYRKTKGMLVACGSLNKITKSQLDFAEKNGFVRQHLTMEQKLQPEYYETPDGAKFLSNIAKRCEEYQKVIIDSFDFGEDKTFFLKQHNIAKEEVRDRIPYAYGRIAEKLAREKMDITILMTGGDTLMGYMKLTGQTQIKPICEIEPGVVVSIFDSGGFSQQIISKSGGFGAEDVLCQVVEKIIKNKRK